MRLTVLEFKKSKAIHCCYLALIIALFTSIAADAQTFTFGNETLHYVITYKWGFITKDAGKATVSLVNTGNKYKVKVTAKSLPWADKIFMVRDTMIATIQKNPFRPLRYEKDAHEGGKFTRDVVTYKYNAANVVVNCVRTKLRNGQWKSNKQVFNVVGQAFDFVSAFFYLRQLDFSKMKVGTTIRKPVFSARRELLTVKYLGVQPVKLMNGKNVNALHLTLSFTNKGKVSSSGIDVWLSTSNPHMPLLIIGSLPVGQVKCYYVS